MVEWGAVRSDVQGVETLYGKSHSINFFIAFLRFVSDSVCM